MNKFSPLGLSYDFNRAMDSENLYEAQHIFNKIQQNTVTDFDKCLRNRAETALKIWKGI